MKNTEEALTVLCYGDSNTHGYDPGTGGRYPYGARWTTILGCLLGSRYRVIPEGLNGRTTAYDKPDAPWKNGKRSLTVCLESHKPIDYVIIMLGTNDCVTQLGLSPYQIADGMDSLVEIVINETPALQGYVPQIIIAAPPLIRGDIKASPFAFELDQSSAAKSQEIVRLYEKVAAWHGVVFADASRMEVAADCEHLTEEGHRQIANLFYSELQKRR